MQMFTELKTRFFRRKPAVRINLDGTQAAGLVNAAHGIDDADHASTHDDFTANGTNHADSMIEAKPNKRQNMAELQRGYEEVIGVVRRIGDHLDEQSDRSERIVELLDRLPQALDVMPEISRQNIRLLESITEYLDESRRREESINDTLDRLSESTSHQTEIIGLVQQQLDAGNDTTRQMSVALTSFRESLAALSASTMRSSDVLAAISKSSHERETRLLNVMTRTERWLIAAMACSITAALAAIAVAFLK